MRVLVSEKIADDGIKILQEKAQVDIKIGLSKEELLNIIEEYDAIIVRSATDVDKALIQKGKNLKVIGRAGTGVDNVDVDEATKKGILVVNTPDGNSNAAAELTIGLIFSICRQIPQAYHLAKNNDFRRGKFKGTELSGKTAGIIGLGRIGTIVATRLKSLNMNICAYDPYISDDRVKNLGFTKCNTISELVQKADIISLHMPKLESTVGLIGENEFAHMKKGVKIINCARGGIINEDALYKALKDGTVSAAALDVLEDEPDFELSPDKQDFKHPLLELDNVVFTPHLGASTIEAQYNVGVMIAQQVSQALNGEMVSAVNLPSMKGDLQSLSPVLALAEKMGSIYFQTQSNPISKIEILYSGEIANIDTKLITLSLLKGFINPIIDTDEQINFVNIEYIVKNKGIEVVESKTLNSTRYKNLILVKFIANEETCHISGTVYENQESRLVDFYGYTVDFEPNTPFALVIQNSDKPGMIGSVGTILGESGVNIASMRLSRNKRGEKAVAFLGIDSHVSKEVLEKIRNTEGILKASIIEF